MHMSKYIFPLVNQQTNEQRDFYGVNQLQMAIFQRVHYICVFIYIYILYTGSSRNGKPGALLIQRTSHLLSLLKVLEEDPPDAKNLDLRHLDID